MLEVKTEKFNGPLDLLLQLIEKQKVEITEISLAEVTDQYLEVLDKMEEKEAEELADFLVLAARLLYLKSKALLPFLEEEDDVDDLEKQLKMYKQFVDASKKIEEMINQKRFTFSREKVVVKRETEFSPPPNKLNLTEMKGIFMVVLKRLDPLVKLPRQAIARTVTLQQKILHLRDFIGKQNKTDFRKLMEKAETKTEVIMSFLAILELVKQRHLHVKQSDDLNNFSIEKI